MSQHEIKINLPGLLKMLGSNIYSEPDVAVREMIQNAHDTCIIRTTKDCNFTDAKIHIAFDKGQKTLTFNDNGTGMTEEELHKYLSIIGEGYTKLQREELRAAGAREAFLLIGQFGIGLLSAFSVADKVEVFTRSYQHNSSGFKWTCEGDIHYMVEPYAKEDIGTQIVLHLTDRSLVLLDDTLLTQSIKKYADFLSTPIYLKGNQINVCTPPWQTKSKQANYSDYIKQRYNLYALATIPFSLIEPLHLEGLLFVPMIPSELTRDFGEVDIYISRMFIKANDKGLLPEWARFVKGLINTSALTPTVSRDEIVHNDIYESIRNLLGDIIMDALKFLEKNSNTVMDHIVATYNNAIKATSLNNEEFFKRICDLVRVSTDAGFVTLVKYLEQTGGTIYYFSERGTSTQHKLLFAHKGLPVVDASWGVEEDFLERYSKLKGIKLERLESDSGTIFQTLQTVDEKWQELEFHFKSKLKIEARAVAFEPNSVPAVLVARPIKRDDKELDQIKTWQQFGFSSSHIRQMFQKMAEDRSYRAIGDDRVLNLNINNALIQQLRDMNRNDTFNLALTAIYSNAVMFAQHYVSPENAEAIFVTYNAAITKMIVSTRVLEEEQLAKTRMEIELSEMKNRMPIVKLSEHRACFFAYPFQQKFHFLCKKIRTIMATHHGIKLMAISVETKDSRIVEDIKHQISESHFGIADISGNNPNVMWELGLMIGYGKPVLILKDQEDKANTPFDLYGNYRVEYRIAKDKTTGEIEYALLEKGLGREIKRIFKESLELENAKKWPENSA